MNDHPYQKALTSLEAQNIILSNSGTRRSILSFPGSAWSYPRSRGATSPVTPDRGFTRTQKGLLKQAFLRGSAAPIRNRSVALEVAEFTPCEVGPGSFEKVVDILYHLQMLPLLFGKQPQQVRGGFVRFLVR